MLVPPAFRQRFQSTTASVFVVLLTFSTTTDAQQSLGEQLSRLFGGRVPQKPCVIAVSPMIQVGKANQAYKISTVSQARSFAANVEANTKGLGRYKKLSIKSAKVPKLCKDLMWTTAYSSKKYNQCMAQWAKQANTKGCRTDETFVMGVRLPLKGKYATLVVKNKRSGRILPVAVLRGKSQKTLARNVGRKIKSAIRQYKKAN